MPSNLLRKQLPTGFVCDRPRRSQWWLSERPIRQKISQLVEVIETQPPAFDGGHYHKRDQRRLVFQVNSEDSPDLVVKAMPLDTLRSRLAHRRYARAEALNLLRAAENGLPVPTVYAFGECRRLGLVQWSAVIMEALPHTHLRERLLVRPQDTELSQLLERASALLEKLYRAGCNHIDFGPHAVMLSAEGPDDDRLIDFQYCRFLSQPRADVLASQAGYFAWSVSTNRDWVTAETMERWFDAVLQRCGLQSQKDALTPLYHQARRRRASIRERLAQ